MSAIVDTLNDILTAVGDIPYNWGQLSITHSRPTKLFQLVAIWNDQVSREKTGEGYTFEKPACFVEMITESAESFIDGSSYDQKTFRFHIVDMELDAANGTMDQNLNVFGYRDKVKQTMLGYTPVNCSTLFYTDEKQDYQHSDIYHYTVDTRGGFLDTQVEHGIMYKEPPTNLELITGFYAPDLPVEFPLVSYIWKVCPINVQVVASADPLVTQTLGNGDVIPLQYELNPDGTLTIPYLTSLAGIVVLTPFMLDNAEISIMPYDLMSGTFDPTIIGGFVIGNQISFNASLPLGVS
jgi:hypothetical protein